MDLKGRAQVLNLVAQAAGQTGGIAGIAVQLDYLVWRQA